MERMQQYISYILKRANENNIPRRIRGKPMQAFSMHYSNAYIHNFHTGLDPNSCTSTAAAIVYWLTGLEITVKEMGSVVQVHPFTSLSKSEHLISDHDKLFVFSTANHKFAIIYTDNIATILHSNQDSMHEGMTPFTLSTYLTQMDIKYLTTQELRSLFDDLQLALTNPDCHTEIFFRYFGIKFKRGDPDDYYFSVIPCSI